MHLKNLMFQDYNYQQMQNSLKNLEYKENGNEVK